MKPILFNTEMVRAILEGRKTATRRIIKDKDIVNSFDCEADGTPIAYIDQATGDSYLPTMPCPYQPGDTLWVRETWNGDWCDHYIYKADGGSAKAAGYAAEPKWRPSIHMPREAARIFLRVTDVRVERLQEISYTELLAEGVIPLGHLPGGCKCSAYTDGCMDGPCVNRDNYEFWRYATPFIKLWDRTVKPADRDTSGWDADPWVWVIEFERISKDEALGGGGN